MSAREGLAGIIEAHDWFTPRGYAWPCCPCGAEFPGGDEEAYAHVATAILAEWLPDALADERVVEAAWDELEEATTTAAAAALAAAVTALTEEDA